MATVAPQALRDFAVAWEHAIDSAEGRNDAATISGIVGDQAHRLEGGYHISREDQPATNYSVILPEDKQGDSEWASGVDMNMIPKDMTLVTGRLLASAKDPDDPRLNVCREFYGTLNGRTVVGWDTYYREPATSDDSHLWHVHVSVLRKYANDPVALAGVLSVIKGETVAEWGGTSGEDDDMPFAIGPIELPSGPNNYKSYSIPPVNSGGLPWGPAWLSIWGDLWDAKAEVRIALADEDGNWTIVKGPTGLERVPIKSGVVWNMDLPDGCRGISVKRLPVGTEDLCTGSLSMSIEYGKR